MEQATAKVVESVNQKVSDFRESALREKNIIIHGVDEAEEGLDRRTEDTELSFTHDMSKSEREANKEKLAEAKRLNDEEKSGKYK